MPPKALAPFSKRDPPNSRGDSRPLGNSLSLSLLHDPLHRIHDGNRAGVKLDIHRIPHALIAQASQPQGLRDEVNRKAALGLDVADRQAGAIHRDESFIEHIFHPLGRNANAKHAHIPLRAGLGDLALAHDMACDFVAAHLISHASAALYRYALPNLQRIKRGPIQGLTNRIKGHLLPVDRDDRLTNPFDSDARARLKTLHPFRVQQDLIGHQVGLPSNGNHLVGSLNDPREHLVLSSRPTLFTAEATRNDSGRSSMPIPMVPCAHDRASFACLG